MLPENKSYLSNILLKDEYCMYIISFICIFQNVMFN